MKSNPQADLAKLISMLKAAGCVVHLMPPARQYFIIAHPVATVVSWDRGMIVLQKNNVNLRQSPEEAEKTLRKWQKIHYTSLYSPAS